ncbi:MAG: site-specific DNA-methyltransferase, partial [Myxococcaceae bacterium]|nr:site-specific DNA-methyltransferase [Myxococcaceae bacterium]
MIVRGDARWLPLDDGIAQCCVTSPPYWGLRDYGVEGQIGLEASLGDYVARLVEVFREVRRVLRPDGTLWLNLGDGYARNPKKGGSGAEGKNYRTVNGEKIVVYQGRRRSLPGGLKPKDLIGLPWLVAFALRADGWWLRSAVVWDKPNALPDSVRDRPVLSYE